MPSHSVSCPAAFSQLHWLRLAALLLTAAACRDTREDANYCKTCTVEAPDSGNDGVATSGQEMVSSREPNMSQAPGVSTGSATMTSGQTGQSGSAANPGKAGAGNASTAGSNGSTTSMRDAGAAIGGSSGSSDPNAGNAGTGNGQGGRGAAASGGSTPARDAGMTTPVDAGRSEPLPCNGSCPEERPVCFQNQCVQCTSADDHACIGDTKTCDGAARKCVQCTLDDVRNCAGETPVCNRNNRCVACTTDPQAGCTGTQSLCEDERRCVECMPGRTDTCPSDHTLCSSDGRCIECTDDSLCTNGMRPRCDRATNSCSGCESDDDCRGRFPATPHCDKTSHACVLCTPEGEPTCGPGNFCNANHTCEPGRPSQTNCARCTKDTECGPSTEIAVCTENNGEKYCFAAANGGACEPGFTAQPVANHTTTPYCLPPAGTSSCVAITNALKKACSNKPDECGKNGVCAMTTNVCTLQCAGPQECPAGTTCDMMQHTCIKQ